ncbi:hypothetical protein MY10362_001287 [Beauveria mimosiformis]
MAAIKESVAYGVVNEGMYSSSTSTGTIKLSDCGKKTCPNHVEGWTKN